MQAEQQGNLDNVVLQGAGIRIPRKFWSADRIRDALRSVLTVPAYRESARRLQQSVRAHDGRREAGRVVWELVTSRQLQPPAGSSARSRW